MAEEHRCQEGHRLCANNCGFFGSPATLNLCSKCYRDQRLKEEQQQVSAAKVAVEKSLPPAASSSAAAVGVEEVRAPSVLVFAPPALGLAEDGKEAERKEGKPPAPAEGPSRCATCRKRVGLTGFRCRCGVTYCGAHRHAEQHGCTFDFKAAGRAAIVRANPVVKANKLHKV